MNDIQIGNFIEITKLGSFTKSEEILNTTKTALKKQIDNLERELGFKLFLRTTKGLELTETGKLFYNKVSIMYLDYQKLLKDCQLISNRFSPEIKVGMYTITNMLNWYLKIELNSSFKVKHVFPSGRNTTHKDNLNLLKQDKIDFLEYEENDLIYEYKLCFKKITEDYLCCIMNDDHPLASKASITLSDLKGYKAYCWSSLSTTTRKLFDLAKEESVHLHTQPYSVNNVLGVCTAGNIFILSHDLATSFAPLKVIPIDPIVPFYRGLVYKPEKEELLKEMIQIAAPPIDA